MLGLTLATILSSVSTKIYFSENFNDANWKNRWVQSTEWKSKGEMGKWVHTAGKWYGDAEDKGVQTGEDARFYGMSAKMTDSFTNDKKDLVVQFSVKWEQQIDCGGAYIKLMGATDQKKFGGDSPYQIMFGPDICGSSNRKTHVIFNYPPKNDNLQNKKTVRVESDQLTHLYTLVVHPNNDYEVLIDDKSAASGKLDEDWEFLLPKEINDPSVSKPKDWVDARKIPDPSDKKPDNYDDIPAEIPDPSAEKPADWDSEEDGEWEAPMIPNPDYKGPWKAKLIDNPDYKGEWVHPTIPNPEYKEDPSLHVRCKDCSYVGFELWQVKSGTIFDDIIVTDSLAEAKEYAEKTFFAKQRKEKEMFDEQEAAKNAAEAAEREKAAAEKPTETESEEDASDHEEL